MIDVSAPIASFGNYLVAGLLYAVLAADHIAVGQFMLSRPLVIGPLVGWYWGNPAAGLFVGIVVEFLWVHVIPVGLWPIDTTVVAALAVTWAVLSPVPGRPALVLALCLAIPCGMAGRSLDIFIRRQNSRFTPWVAERINRGFEGSLPATLVLSVGVWIIKAVALFLVLAPLGQWLIGNALSFCPRRLIAALDWTGRLLPFLAVTVVLNYLLQRIRLNISWLDSRN